MLDEKLEDHVWVTVVATGYGDARSRRREADRPGISDRSAEPRQSLREPPGEPRVSRVRERSGSLDLDVPEFIPRR
jgi:cell division protein FtsZ